MGGEGGHRPRCKILRQLNCQHPPPMLLPCSELRGRQPCLAAVQTPQRCSAACLSKLVRVGICKCRAPAKLGAQAGGAKHLSGTAHPQHGQVNGRGCLQTCTSAEFGAEAGGHWAPTLGHCNTARLNHFVIHLLLLRSPIKAVYFSM